MSKPAPDSGSIIYNAEIPPTHIENDAGVVDAEVVDAGVVSDSGVNSDAYVYVPKHTVVCDGDSITQGILPGWIYPDDLRTLIGDTVINVGLSGKTIMNLLVEASAKVDSLFVPNQKSVVVIFAGTNDLANIGQTVDQTYPRLVQYIRDRKTVGWKVIVVTMLPRTPGIPDSQRQEFNGRIYAEWPRYADQIADVAADPRIGCANCNHNTVYYSADTIHPNNVGEQIIAEDVAKAYYALP